MWKKMRSLHLTALARFSFSILIEISQLLNNRRTDIDDLIMNTLGSIIGFLI
ncbi:VanZ family protein [[Ruminococcus] torques]|nr:VanZ family protein [[Ruminococcus] torques]